MNEDSSSAPKNSSFEFTEDETSFCRVKIEEFTSSTCLPSDIFIRLGAGRFLKIARENTAIDLERIRHYKDRHVEYFLVRNEDFHKYSGLNLKLVKAVSGKSNIPPEKKFALFKHTGEVLLQQVFVSGLNKDLCDDAQMVIMNTLTIISQNDELLDVLLVMQGAGDRVYSHSVGTAAYTSLIARKKGWTSTPNHYKLAMASMFHDVGWRELPKELQEKPRIKMTTEEVRLRESHSTRSRDILSQIKGFPSDLVQIVAQQHENQRGTGFPGGLFAAKIHPLAKVLHVADEFCYLLIEKNCKSKAEVQDAAMALYEMKGEELEYESVEALFQALDLLPPRQLKNAR